MSTSMGVTLISDECWQLWCIHCTHDECIHICHKPKRTEPKPISEDKWHDIANDAMEENAAWTTVY